MEKRIKQIFHLATLINILIAVIYLVFRYYIRVENEFGEIPSPIQPWFQYLHILFVIPWLFVFGMLFQEHILPMLNSQTKKKRKSGIVLISIALLMVFSGYVIQVSTPSWIGPTHAIVSLLWVVTYLWHTLRD